MNKKKKISIDDEDIVMQQQMLLKKVRIVNCLEIISSHYNTHS